MTTKPQEHHRYLADDNEHEAYASVGLDGLLAATEKLLAVNRGLAEPDDRDSLPNDRIHTADRLIAERVKLDHGRTLRKTMGRLSRAKSLAPMGSDVFGEYTVGYLKSNPLVPALEEINPLHNLEQKRRITKMGPGGIGDPNAITAGMQAVDASQFGFIDAIAGPECLDGASEVYTMRGWVRWDQVSDHDIFACKVDGCLEWHEAERIVREHYCGDMIVAENKTLRMVVTPNHRVIHTYTNGGNDFTHTAAEVFGKSIRMPARHLPGADGRDASMVVTGLQFVDYFRKWTDGCLDKYIPEDLFSAPLAARQRMFDALIRGDGTCTSKHLKYCTVSARLAASVERLAVSLGYSAYTKQVGMTSVGRPYFNVCIIRVGYRSILGAHWTRQRHDGLVYCATVPGGQLHVRGKAGTSGYWTGNSEKAGIDVRLAHGTRVGSDGRIYQLLINRKTGKKQWVSPSDLLGKTLKLPD